MNSLGIHHLIDFQGCSADRINDTEFVRGAMLEAAARAGATIVTDVFHTFSPQGVSGVVVIAESHIAIHTWPEFGAASIDIFSCTEKLSAVVATDILFSAFCAKEVQTQVLARGRVLDR